MHVLPIGVHKVWNRPGKPIFWDYNSNTSYVMDDMIAGWVMWDMDDIYMVSRKLAMILARYLYLILPKPEYGTTNYPGYTTEVEKGGGCSDRSSFVPTCVMIILKGKFFLHLSIRCWCKLLVTSDGIDEIRPGFDIFIRKTLNVLKMSILFYYQLLTSR